MRNVHSEAVEDLLLHVLAKHPMSPELVTIQHEDGGHGVALVLDGWYSTRDSAREVLPFWAESLARLRAETRPT